MLHLKQNKIPIIGGKKIIVLTKNVVHAVYQLTTCALLEHAITCPGNIDDFNKF